MGLRRPRSKHERKARELVTTPIAVCIPSIGRSPLLMDLVDVVLDELDVDPEAVEIWDNSENEAYHPWAPTIHAPDSTIYQEWNEFAKTYGATHHLAFLNDDIAMMPGTLQAFALACDTGWQAASVAARPNEPRVDRAWHPRLARGTFRQGGLNGWAFMVAKGAYPPEGIDDEFQVWYGDDDLFWKMSRAGCRLCVLEGVSVYHETSTTVNSLDWVPAAQAADADRWKALCRA